MKKLQLWDLCTVWGKMRRTLSVIFLLIGSVAECLELYRVEVPHYKRVGELAELQCQFHLGRDRLYAVKWYKDDAEFFRYVPRFNPSVHTHSVPGVHVDALRSTSEVVYLKSVGVRSSGVYKCEVSAEAPSFASFMGEGRMTVVYLPKEGPQITGNLRDEYEVGDMLDLNCTSSKSWPPTRLSWYINDIPVMGHTEPAYYDGSMELLPTTKHLTGTPTHTTPNNNNGHNLIRSTSRRLLLPLTPTHFGSKGTARIRCVARIFPLFWQDGDEKKIDHKNSSHHHNNKVGGGGSGNKHANHNSHNNNANAIPNHPQLHNNNFNEVDDGPESHQQFRLGSLYKGEALVQIRGGCGCPSATWNLALLVLLILLLSSAH